MTVWAFLYLPTAGKGEFIQHILPSAHPDQQVKQIGQTQQSNRLRKFSRLSAFALDRIPIENRLLHRQRTQFRKFIRRQHLQTPPHRPHESSSNLYLGFHLLRSWNIELYPPPIPPWAGLH